MSTGTGNQSCIWYGENFRTICGQAADSEPARLFIQGCTMWILEEKAGKQFHDDTENCGNKIVTVARHCLRL